MVVIADAVSAMAAIRAWRPTFRNAADKVVFAVHATFFASGFYLNATGAPAFDLDTFASPSTTDGVSNRVKVLCLVEDHKVRVVAMRHGDSTLYELKLKVHDYVENGGRDYHSQYKNFEYLVKEIKQVVMKYIDSSAIESSSRTSTYLSRFEDVWDSPAAVYWYGYIQCRQCHHLLPVYVLGYLALPFPGIRGMNNSHGLHTINFLPSHAVFPYYGVSGFGIFPGPYDAVYFIPRFLVLPVPMFWGSNNFHRRGTGVFLPRA
ncbi:unnamed protein product [Cuscuta campestris]|uniref:PI31 proteasome regulator N-terminal domain-containing protein n=1 Tax=Cuscuta campestris TaxID=132261 RepID=A0A484MPS9_9ASTE|nr:unnamed protein product [Cuscuta campestris]